MAPVLPSAAGTSIAGSEVAKDEPPTDDGPTRRKSSAPAPAIVPKEAPKEDVDVDEDDDEEEDVVMPEARPSFDRSEIEKGDVKYRQDAVHVYGLDFLKTEHMNEIFSQFEHRFIEWINDSSANIVFRSKDSAKKALESLSYPKIGDAPWRRTPDILVNDDCPPIFLQMRLATRSDVKKGKKAVPKVSAADSSQAPVRNRSAGGRGLQQPYRDGISTELLEQAGLLGKRKSQEPLTEEELKKRQKRREKFGCSADENGKTITEKTSAVANSEDVTPVVGSGVVDGGGQKKEILGEAVELTEEELARRKKRLERFHEEDAGKATPKAVVTGEKAAEGKAGEN